MGHLQVQVALDGNVWVKCWKVALVCVTSVLDLLLPGTSHFVHPVVSRFKKQTTVPRPRYAATLYTLRKSSCVLYAMVDLESILLIWYLPFTIIICSNFIGHNVLQGSFSAMHFFMTPVAADVSSGQETPADRTSGTNPKQQSLRRNFSTTLRKTGDFSLKSMWIAHRNSVYQRNYNT